LKTVYSKAVFVFAGLIYEKSDCVVLKNGNFLLFIGLFIFLCHSLTCAARQVIKESGLCEALIFLI